MKHQYKVGSIVAIALLGAGCITTTPAQNPAAYADGNLYRQTPSSSLPIGIGESYRPADPAPPTTTDPNPVNVSDNNADGPSTNNDTVKNTVVTQTKTPPPLAYNDALNIYRNHGAYMQFASCRGNPGSISLKKNTKFMIDNRDNVPREYIVGNTEYVVAKYGFVIVTAPLYPGTYYITCNGGGAAAIQVQN